MAFHLRQEGPAQPSLDLEQMWELQGAGKAAAATRPPGLPAPPLRRTLGQGRRPRSLPRGFKGKGLAEWPEPEGRLPAPHPRGPTALDLPPLMMRHGPAYSNPSYLEPHVGQI